MTAGSSGKGRGRKSRVDFRPNRQKPRRQKQWSVPEAHDVTAQDAPEHESVRAKGDLSRKRTIIDRVEGEPRESGRRCEGTVVAVRGQFVEVSDGERTWPCSVRRILRTRRIEQRTAVVVGDRVSFAPTESKGVVTEGVIEEVHPRRTVLMRSDGRRTQLIAANVDQVLIVGSMREPWLKPHLIDRYLVAAHAGNLPAAIGLNKVDLDEDDETAIIVERYSRLGYQTFSTSATTGAGIDELRSYLCGKITLFAGQSGVGKSSLLNAVQPGLNLRTAHVSIASEKGRHTTTTAVWYELDIGASVIDTPGIRALDVAMVPLNELEMHFVEFVDRLAHCKFHNCVHIHESGCAIKAAVEAGEIDPSRYESYMQLFLERSKGRS